MITGLSLAAAGLLVMPHTAYADPSAEELEQQINELTEEQSAIVEELNQAQEDVEAAERRVEELDEEIGDEEERYNELRDDIISIATTVYSREDASAPETLLTADSPEEIQQEAADLGYLSDSHAAALEEFSGSAERLFSLQDEAEEALEEAEEIQQELDEQREEVESTLAEHEEQYEEVAPEAAGASYNGSASGNAGAALDFAFSKIGLPYCWGGTGPDCYDCSGLTQAAWGAAGVSLPRTTGSQVGVGQQVAYSDLQPGDLLFFYPGITHVGMYAGDGQMVHAPNSSSTVQVVNLSDYYQSVFQTARRP